MFLIARFLFRRTRVMNLLAAVALVYLLWDPSALFDASFQLSFLCVAAIGALAAPLLEPTHRAAGARPARPPRRRARRRIWTRASAQARVEMRLAAETLALWIALPAALGGARRGLDRPRWRFSRSKWP